MTPTQIGIISSMLRFRQQLQQAIEQLEKGPSGLWSMNLSSGGRGGQVDIDRSALLAFTKEQLAIVEDELTGLGVELEEEED